MHRKNSPGAILRAQVVMLYKAFISYSHAAEGKLAPLLQSALQKFAKPFYRLRAIRVFRDETSLALTPKLWPTIQAALKSSEYLVLMASPAAAKSEWVQAEVAEWLTLNGGSSDKILIILAGGELIWDKPANDFDWDQTTAVPRSLSRTFSTEPLFLDFRWATEESQLSLRNPKFLRGIARLAATLRNMPLDAIVGEDVRQHRITRIVMGVVAVLLLGLTVAASGAAYYATMQQAVAEHQAKVALAGQLAARAELDYSQRGDLLERGVLLAIEAARIAPQPSLDTNLALRHGLDLLPTGMIEIPQRTSVFELVVSSDGVHAAAASGNVVTIWQVADGHVVHELSHADTVFGLAFTPDGSRIVTADGDVHVWRIGDGQLENDFELEGRVIKIAISPDGAYLATRQDNVATIWEFETRRKICSVTHDNEQEGEIFSKSINAIAFSPDSKSFATAADDHTARVWNTATGQQMAIAQHDDEVRAVAYDPTGELVATASGDRTTRILSVETGEEIARLEHDGPVNAVAFSPDGAYVATATSQVVGARNVGNHTESFDYTDFAAHIWDVGTAKKVLRLPHLDTVWTVAFGPDGRYLASGSSDGTARLWDVASGREVARMIHRDSVTDLAFTADGKSLITAAETGGESQKKSSVRIWSTADPGRAGVFPHRPNDYARAMAFDPTGKYLAIGTSGVATAIYERESGAEADGVFHTAGTTALAFSSDGNYLAVAFQNNGLNPQTMMPESGEQVTALLVKRAPTGYIPPFEKWAGLVHGHETRDLAFSPDGKFLITYGDDRAVRIWDVETRQTARQLAHDAAVDAFAYSPSASLIATASGKTVRLWDFATGQPKAQLQHSARLVGLAFSSDGQSLATASGDGTVRWWTSSGQLLWENACPETPSKIHVDPAGTYVAVLCDDGVARLFDAKDGKETMQLRHEARITDMILNADGRYLATRGLDRTIRIWRTADRAEVARFQNGDSLPPLGFDPSGRYFYMQTPAGAIRVLWRPDDLVAEACRRLSRNLTPDEWQRFLPGSDYAETCGKPL